MSAHTFASVLQLLRQGQLLGDEELCAIEGLRRQSGGKPSELLRTILKRGWLTPYQASELFSGRGGELHLGESLVLEPLGAGSTARVFRARHLPSGRVVALKVLSGGMPWVAPCTTC
jgi:hypothetical protein